MELSRLISSAADAVRRILRVIARPASLDKSEDGVVIQPYRGYGSHEELYLMGRIFRQMEFKTALQEGTLIRDLVNIVRRFLRWGIGEAVIIARFGSSEQRVVTDHDGYFHIHIHLNEPPPGDRLWHEVELEVVQPTEARAEDAGDVFVPPESARYVVISDIDDTVVLTGVANKVMMMWRLFAQGARSRVAFPGVAALYRGLHEGKSGAEQNPILYVSRGPWSIYELLDEFFSIHDIPVGPILFLREWGLTPQRPLPWRAEGHKLDLIRDMMDLYSDYPFILIGDSGQHDPELYARVVQEFPDRVEAIYIRNVSRGEKRVEAIEALAAQTIESGTSLVLAADSFAMAEHAAEIGLISAGTLAEVLREREMESGTTEREVPPQGEEEIKADTSQAVSEGRLRRALEDEPAEKTPPNVRVTPETESSPETSQK